MADLAKSISGGYNKNMKDVADLQRAGAMEADGAEQESTTFGSILSA